MAQEPCRFGTGQHLCANPQFCALQKACRTETMMAPSEPPSLEARKAALASRRNTIMADITRYNSDAETLGQKPICMEKASA